MGLMLDKVVIQMPMVMKIKDRYHNMELPLHYITNVVNAVENGVRGTAS